MSLLIRTIFPFQYLENTVSGPGTNYNNFINSSVINDSVSTPNFFTSNGYPKYLFDNTLHKFLSNIFIIKNKTSDNQEKAILCFSSVFPDGEEVYNRQKCQLSYPYHQLLFMQKETNPTVTHQLPSFNSLRLNSSSVVFRSYVKVYPD